MNCAGCDPIRFFPGINEVTDHHLACMQKHPAFNAKIQDGSFQLIEEKKVGSDGKKSVQEVLQMIPQILQVKLLKKIMAEDGRQIIIDACQKQIEYINLPKKTNEDLDGITVK